MMLRQQLLKYAHQKRLFFSTTARRRRKKPKLPSTTKDRLRRVVPRSPSQKIDADLVTERLQTRLEWVRSNIEGLWKDSNATNRPDRYELAIDGNWWTWNILLALTPGILIATYCEFVAKPMMLKLRKDGSDGLPQPSSSSFLGDLYDGLMHYVYGMEPVGTNHIQSETNNKTLDTKSSLPETDLQQLQALKEKIQELEDRLTTPQRPGPGIRQRHQMTAPNKPEEPPSDAAGESVPSAAGWIPVLQTFTEYMASIQETASSVVFPSSSSGTTGKENDASNPNVAVNVGATDVPDLNTTSSSQAPVSSSSLYSTTSNSKEENSITSAEESSTSRRWWQLWK